MNFIMVPDNVKQITAMKLSPNKNNSQYLILAEQHKDNPGCFISVYNMKESCYVASKVHNITELSEGKGNAIINGVSVNLNSNNNQAANALNATGN